MRIMDCSSDMCSSDLLGDGPARLSAAEGAYDIDNERVTIPGTIRLEARDGYALLARNVTVDLETRRLEGSGGVSGAVPAGTFRSEEHTSELQSLMRISYAVFCLKKKKQQKKHTHTKDMTHIQHAL